MASANPAISTDPQSQPLSGQPAGISRSGFIASPFYDLVFFILSPLLALAIIQSVVLSNFTWVTEETVFGHTRLAFFIGVWTYAHLFAVVFRSHANPEVFRQYRVRFVVVPIVLFVGFLTSQWLLITGIVIAVFWDVYHTSMQNFGFCRIYDAKMGNPPDRGRLLDIWLNHLIYIGPIIGGLSLRSHLEAFSEFRVVGWDLPIQTIAPILSVQGAITVGIAAVGAAFVAYYVYAYWRMSQDGYRFSPQKALLIVSTAGASIYAWGFLHPIQAFFVANFFHGLQYFAIVWWREKTNIVRRSGLSRVAGGRALALIGYLVSIFAVGVWYKLMATDRSIRWAVCVGLIISLMHFWYDGFIWSVRKRHIG